jgi:hypothetical protein
MKKAKYRKLNRIKQKFYKMYRIECRRSIYSWRWKIQLKNFYKKWKLLKREWLDPRCDNNGYGHLNFHMLFNKYFK